MLDDDQGVKILCQENNFVDKSEHLYPFSSDFRFGFIMAFLRVYHPREPKKSPLWQILDKHYEKFERSYEEKFESQYGFFRPVIG
mgnify:CR=1 FL=1